MNPFKFKEHLRVGTKWDKFKVKLFGKKIMSLKSSNIEAYEYKGHIYITDIQESL